jgi:hypothetical protein
LDLLNVGYVLVGHGADNQGLPTGAESLTPLPMDGDDLVLAARRTTAWPRAFFVDRVSHYRGVNQFVAQLRDSSGPFASIDVADRKTTAELDEASESAEVYEPATNYKLTANRTSFRVHAPGPGVAVLTEAWMADDFIATLNGRRVPYFRVNHAFKGVRIPAAGDWTVQFRYRPSLWYPSWAVAALGLIGLFFFPLTLRAHA